MRDEFGGSDLSHRTIISLHILIIIHIYISLIVRRSEFPAPKLNEYISKNSDGSYDLVVTLPEDEWVYGYILSFGNNAEVLKPAHLREIIKTRAKEVAAKY